MKKYLCVLVHFCLTNLLWTQSFEQIVFFVFLHNSKRRHNNWFLRPSFLFAFGTNSAYSIICIIGCLCLLPCSSKDLGTGVILQAEHLSLSYPKLKIAQEKLNAYIAWKTILWLDIKCSSCIFCLKKSYLLTKLYIFA